MSPRIGVISPMTLVVADVDEAFRSLWPEAVVGHTVDEMIYLDYIGKDRIYTPAIHERVTSLVAQNAKGNPDAMLFTGSVFGEPVERIRAQHKVPLLTAFDGLIESAFEAGRNFGIITTSPWSRDDLMRDLNRYAKAKGLAFTARSEVREDARKVILQERDREKHDRMVAESATRLTDVDAILLGQFSLTSSANKVAKLPGRAVLTTTHTAIAKLKRVVAAKS